MSANDKHINKYSVSDIQKYLNGELSDREMYALEKAALEDPFLMDAWEGMEKDRSLRGEMALQNDWNELKKRLEDRIARKDKPIVFPLFRSGWRVAAALILLIGLGAITYRYLLNGHGSTPALAKAEKNITLADSSAADKTLVAPHVAPPPAAPGSVAAVLPDTILPTAEPPVTNARAARKPGHLPLPPRSESLRAGQKEDVNSYGQREDANNYSSRKTDSVDLALNPSPKLSPDSSPDWLTLKKETIRMRADKSISLAQSKAAPAGAMLQGKSSGLEIGNKKVVTGYGAQNALPVSGWPEYKSWLEKNKWKAIGDSTLKGDEIISFKVNGKGELSSFKIEQSLSPAHDSAIIQLIRQGPAWKLTKGRKGRATVTVSF